MDCEYCGPVCYGGAAHNARVEDNAKYAPVSGASPDSKARRREDMLGRLNRAEFGSADQQAVWELLEDYAALTAEQEIQRLGDLVRYARHFLHDNGLVSNEEFAALVADAEDGKRVARLGAYDAARQEIERLRKALARYKDVQDGHGIYSAGAEKAQEAEGGKVASLRENHPFGSIYDALRKTEAERDKFNASNERLNADHARIVAEKDAEIQRLCGALESLLGHHALTDSDSDDGASYWCTECNEEAMIGDEIKHRPSCSIGKACAALNPPQKKDASK